MSTQLDQFGDLKIIDILGEGSMSIVYHARRGETDYALKLIKIHKEDSARKEIESLKRFRRESAALSRLDHPGLVKILEAGDIDEQPYILMELVHGIPLAEKIKLEPMKEEAVIELALALVNTLTEIHRHGLVHRDIKPANIIIEETGIPRIIDFGLAAFSTDLTEESEQTIGTFLYAAPEQTGMFRRSIDQRTDLYALGVSLFEVATGQLPFQADDAAELLTKHAHELPPKVRALVPSLSQALEEIIFKLMAKDPDDRYQTSKGLMEDLRRINELNDACTLGQKLRLGSFDTQKNVTYQTSFIGNTEKINELLNIWNNVESQGAVVLVEGEGGSGKTRLIQEFIARTGESDPLILSGKFQQGANVPLGALKEAVDSYLSSILQLPETDKKRELELLREAATDNYHLIKNLSAGIGVLIKIKEKKAVESYSSDLFYKAVAAFLCNLARLHKRAVLHLDDLQWIDDASLQVIAEMIKRLESSPLMIACTIRNDAVNIAAQKNINMSLAHEGLKKIVVTPLSESEIVALISAHLGGQRIDQAYVNKIMTRSGGNPFAIGEYLRALQETGTLQLNRGEWFLNEELLDALSLPTNIADLVLHRKSALSQETTEVLAVCSVLGMKFSQKLLQDICNKDANELNQILTEAIETQVIVQHGEENYSFIHDRLREGFLKHSNDQQRKEINQRIAETIEQRHQDLPNYVFEVATHYADGDTEKYPEKVFQSSLEAGFLALKNFSYQQAIDFLERADVLLPKIKTSDKVLVKLYESLGDAYHGKLDSVKAVAYIHKALGKTRDKLIKARLHSQLATIYACDLEVKPAYEALNTALKLLNKPISASTLGRAFSLLINFTGMFIAELLHLPRLFVNVVPSEKRRVLLSLYSIGTRIAILLFRSDLILYSMLKGMTLSQFCGKCSVRVQLQSHMGFVFALLRRRWAFRYFFKKASEQALRLSDPSLIAYVESVRLMSTDLLGECKETDKALLSFRPQLVWLNPSQFSHCLSYLSTSKLLRGHFEESLFWRKKVMDESSELIKKDRNASTYGGLAACYFPLGNKEKAEEYLQRCLDAFPEVEGDILQRNLVTYQLTFISYNTGLLKEKILELHRQWKELIPDSRSVSAINRPIYVNFARFYLNKYLDSPQEERETALQESLSALNDLERCAQSPQHWCYIYLIKAAHCRMDKNFSKARELLKLAEEDALKVNSISVECDIILERARIAIDENSGQENIYIQKAYNLAVENSWQLKAENIAKEFPLVTLERAQAASEKVPSTTSYQGKVLDTKYLNALLEVNLASAGALDPEEQARSTLDSIVELLGGDRAFLFTTEGGNQESMILLGGRTKGGQDLGSAENYSTTVIKRVLESMEPVIVTGTKDGLLLGSESAIAHDLRSIMAAPLLVREKLIGVVYIDNKVVKGAFKQDDVRFLMAMANHIAVNLEAARSARLEIQRKQMQNDLELTAAVQSFFLPAENMLRTSKISLVGNYRPATRCGGDWWWFQELGPDKILILMGDVTGHGAASAMLTAAVAATYRVLYKLNANIDVKDTLEFLNNELLLLCQGEFHMTLGAILIDQRERTLSFYSAASPPVFISSKTGEWKTMSVAGSPIGVEHLQLGEEKIDLQGGERVFLYTDGIFEQTVGTKRPLGLKNMIKVFAQANDQDIIRAETSIASEFSAMMEDVPQEDDMTFVILDFERPAADSDLADHQ